MRKWLIVIAVLVVAGGAYAYRSLAGSKTDLSYRLVSVEKGDVEAVVSATGALEAVTTVEVGTQVSGMISKLMVDFNDHVTKGQVIAQLDTTVLDSAVADAEATLERNQAELAQATRDFNRLESLHRQGITSDQDFNAAQYNLDVARAAMKSANASLDRAHQNLAYATITAPVSGTVVERDVDVGQTVAASFSSPRLFLIANDLSHMQILAAVDESDIGSIREGQHVRFTVKAYPERHFTGMVRQVRLQSTTDQNVVSYTVVVDVQNPDHVLLPGMTATVEFLVDEAKGVLKVANAALRFRPTEAMIAELRSRRQAARAGQGRGAADGGGQPGQRVGGMDGAGRPGPAGVGGGGERPTLLWYLDADGQPAVVPVRPGLTDGQYTEVTGPGLEPGMEVIAGVSQATAAAASSPFQRDAPRHGPRGGF